MSILNLDPYDNPQRLVFYTNDAIVFLLRGWDLAAMVETARIDIAFCGTDTIEELGSNVVISKHFETMKSPIALCKRKDVSLDTRNHLSVATEYPNLTKKILSDRYKDLEVIHVHGATEALAHLDKVDAIVDIVETGQTLESNYLHLTEILSYTYPCLIHSRYTAPQLSPLDFEDLATRIENAFRDNSMR